MNRARKVARMYAEHPREARPVLALAGLNRAQLRTMAKDRGVRGYGRMTPAQLRDAIRVAA